MYYFEYILDNKRSFSPNFKSAKVYKSYLSRMKENSNFRLLRQFGDSKILMSNNIKNKTKKKLMKYKIGSWDTGQTWNVSAKTEKSAIRKVIDKNPYISIIDLHCISCTHSSSELKTKKMAKKMRKPLSAYKVKLSFKSKAGKTFTKGFLSLSSAKRAVAGWKSAGGQMAGKMMTTKTGRKYRSKKSR